MSLFASLSWFINLPFSFSLILSYLWLFVKDIMMSAIRFQRAFPYMAVVEQKIAFKTSDLKMRENFWILMEFEMFKGLVVVSISRAERTRQQT